MRSAVSIITRPVISEKAFALAENGQYVFLVRPEATKLQVRGAVEREFSVHVRAVNSLTTKGRPRRYGKVRGLTKDYKKMIVTLRAGEKIAMFEGEAKDDKKDGKKDEKKEEKKEEQK